MRYVSLLSGITASLLLASAAQASDSMEVDIHTVSAEGVGKRLAASRWKTLTTACC